MSTFSELIDFTRSSTGTYLDSVVYGDELVTNGGFDSASNWTITAAAAASNISNGVAYVESAGANAYMTQQLTGVTAGKVYRLEFNLISEASSAITDGLAYVRFAGVDVAHPIGQREVGVQAYIFTASSGSQELRFMTYAHDGASFTIDNVSVKEIIGGQGTAGTPLLRTADTNEPRLEYDAYGQPLGLLLEEQRSNLLHQSEAFDDNYWAKVQLDALSNGVAAPDGTTDTITLSATTTNGAYIGRSNLGSAGQGYTASVYAKAGTHDVIRITNQSSGTSGGWFDLTNGTTLTSNGANNVSRIEYVGNGWYRCSRYFDSWVNTNNAILFGVSLSDGSTQSAVGDTVSLWGAQLELGAFPTSYIPTSGSTVTRNQDVCRIEKEKYHLHQKKGTIYCEFDAITSTDETILEYQRIYELATTDSDDRVTAWIKNDDGTLTSQLYDNNVAQAGGALKVGYNGKVNTIKVATAYGVNHFQASNDGMVGSIDASVNLDNTRYRLAIMQRTNTGSPLCGHMKRITYTPKVLSEAQLIELTKPSSSPTMSLTFDGQTTSELVEGLHD